MQSPTTKAAPPGGAEVKGSCKGATKRPSDFSIEHILKKAGRERSSCAREEGNLVLGEEERPSPDAALASTRFEWLQCTRYHPPKLPRSRRKEGARGVGPQKAPSEGGGRRKLGRNPRIPFSSAQVSALESRFRRGHYLSSADVNALAHALQLSEARVKIWFQNRRARERRDREAVRASAEGPSPLTDADKQGAQVSTTSEPPEYVGSRLEVPGSTPGAHDTLSRPSNLFPRASLLQGLNSAFVPFPRARHVLKEASSDSGHLPMTSPEGGHLTVASPSSGHISMASLGGGHITMTSSGGSHISMYSGHSPPPTPLSMVAAIQGQAPASV